MLGEDYFFLPPLFFPWNCTQLTILRLLRTIWKKRKRKRFYRYRMLIMQIRISIRYDRIRGVHKRFVPWLFKYLIINSLKSIRFPRKFSSIKLLYKSFVKKRVWKIIQILKFNLILHCVTKRARLCNILLSTLKNKSVHFFFNSKSSDFRSKKKLDRMTWRKKEKRKKKGEIRSRGTKRVSRSWWNRESLYN